MKQGNVEYKCAASAEALFEEMCRVNRCDVVNCQFQHWGIPEGRSRNCPPVSLGCAHLFIDNASTDGSLDFLPQGHNDRLTIINNTANLGFAAVCNLGLIRTASECDSTASCWARRIHAGTSPW